MGDIETAEFATILLVFRVVFGIVFAGHGWGKIKGGIDGTAGWFDGMGMKPGKLHAYLAAGTEIGTGILLALGLLTPFAAAGVIGVMVVAAWTSHRDNGFWIVGNGWEYTFMVGLTAAAIAGLGPGDYSLDHALDISDSLNGFVGAAIAIIVGIVGGVAQLAIFYRPPAKQD